MPYANNKGALFVRSLDNTVSVLAKSKSSRLYLVTVAEQTGLSLTCSKPPEDMFSRDEAQYYTISTKANKGIAQTVWLNRLI